MVKLALSVKETAEALGVSADTVYWMCYNEELPHKRVVGRGSKGQGKILISVKEIERWLESA